MKLVRICSLLLLATLCSAVDLVEKEEEKAHVPSHAVCQQHCRPEIGDCVNQGNNYYVCIPKKSHMMKEKKAEKPEKMKKKKEGEKPKEEEEEEEFMDDEEEKGHLYGSSWPYRSTYGAATWPLHAYRSTYGVRPVLSVRPTYGIRHTYGARPVLSVRPTYGVASHYGLPSHGVRTASLLRPRYFPLRSAHFYRRSYGVPAVY
jgi:ribosomal protein L12E/L44/L45/RPP1/RPP2